MSETVRCQVQVPEPPGYWHRHTCNRPAKTKDGLCGIHARQAERAYPGTREAFHPSPPKRRSNETSTS